MDLPEGVRIVNINPRSLTLHLEPLVERGRPRRGALRGRAARRLQARRRAGLAPERARARPAEPRRRRRARLHRDHLARRAARDARTPAGRRGHPRPQGRPRRVVPSRCASRSARSSPNGASRASRCARPRAQRSRRRPSRSRCAARARSSRHSAPRTCALVVETAEDGTTRAAPRAPTERAGARRTLQHEPSGVLGQQVSRSSKFQVQSSKVEDGSFRPDFQL